MKRSVLGTPPLINESEKISYLSQSGSHLEPTVSVNPGESLYYNLYDFLEIFADTEMFKTLDTLL